MWEGETELGFEHKEEIDLVDMEGMVVPGIQNKKGKSLKETH